MSNSHDRFEGFTEAELKNLNEQIDHIYKRVDIIADQVSEIRLWRAQIFGAAVVVSGVVSVVVSGIIRAIT